MKKFTKLAIVTLFGMATIFAVAQNAGPRNGQGKPGAPGGQGKEGRPGGPGGGGRGMMGPNSPMMKDLKLTAAQKTQIEALGKKMQEKMKAMRDANKGGAGKPEDMRAKMQAFRTDYEAGLKKILTADQWKMYQAKMAEMRKNRPAGPGGPGAPGGKAGAGKGGKKGG